jgi:ankyrin repeat protein
MNPPSPPPEVPSRALIDAALICDLVRVRELLARGADPNVRDDDGRTPLFSAVLGGSLGLVGLMLESRADVNARDNDGFSPLHFAAQEYLPEIARLLIAKGADVNAVDNDGRSVLWRAVFSSRGRDEIIRLLRTAGAKSDTPDAEGVTPEDLAERKGVRTLSDN